jgi:two-component system, sensor histidine kinase YesM
MTFRKGIASRYLKGFVFIIVIPVLIIYIILNNVFIGTLRKNASNQILQAMEQIAFGLANEGKRDSLLAATIANDDEIIDLATRWNRETESNSKFYLSKQIDSKLNYLFNYTYDVDSVLFFFKRQGCYYYKNSPVTEENLIRKDPGFALALRNKNEAVITGSLNQILYSLGSHYTIAVWIAPVTAEYRNDVTLIYFAFRSDVLNNILLETESSGLGEFLVIDKDGKIFGANHRMYLNKNIRSYKFYKKNTQVERQSFISSVKKQKMFISTYKIPKMNWELINLQNYRVLTNDTERLWRSAIFIFLLLIGLFVAFSILFFREMIVPVNRLIRQMKRVEQGKFNAEIEVGGNDEFYQLGTSFNKMVHEVKKLMAERDMKEKERLKAELEALKSQINPHFIANTLNSIRLMAMIAKVDSIQNMTEAFMKLLTSSLGKDEATITIAAEMENLRNYIHIMKVRFGDNFDVSFNVDETLDKTSILKMLLQPILENAILHGMSETEAKGVIQVTVSHIQEDIVFEIYDNGVGISSEQIQELLTVDHRNPKGFSSIGIRNVDRRIKLNYGNRYGLTIESSPGEYTRVKILLPMLNDEKGEFESVSNDGCG